VLRVSFLWSTTRTGNGLPISEKISENFSENFRKSERIQKISENFRKFQKISENFRKFQKIVQSIKSKTGKNLTLRRFLPLVRFRLRGRTSTKSSLVTDNLEFQIFDKDLCGRRWERGRDKVSGQGCASGL